MSNITITIRSQVESYLKGRRRDLITAGFQVSLVALEPGLSDVAVYTFDLYADFEQAHKLERRDDRWKAANSFFQRAEAAENKRGWYAKLANDWSAFGYRDHTLSEYLAIEHQRQELR